MLGGLGCGMWPPRSLRGRGERVGPLAGGGQADAFRGRWHTRRQSPVLPPSVQALQPWAASDPTVPVKNFKGTKQLKASCSETLSVTQVSSLLSFALTFEVCLNVAQSRRRARRRREVTASGGAWCFGVSCSPSRPPPD